MNNDNNSLPEKPAPFAAAAARILAIDPGSAGVDRGVSEVLLIREYLRRAALWAEALESPQRWPFFDAAQILVQAPSLGPGDDDSPPFPLSAEIEAHLASFSFYPKRLLRGYLNWSLLSQDRSLATGLPDLPDLPDLYEPIVRLCERGGTFYLENGMFFTDGGGGLLGRQTGYLSRPPFVTDLSDSALDALDKEDRQREAE